MGKTLAQDNRIGLIMLNNHAPVPYLRKCVLKIPVSLTGSMPCHSIADYFTTEHVCNIASKLSKLIWMLYYKLTHGFELALLKNLT